MITKPSKSLSPLSLIFMWGIVLARVETEMSRFTYTCPKCGTEMRVSEEVFLTRIKSCPRCGYAPQDSLAELRMNRFRFLNLLYKKSGGDEDKDFNMFNIGHELKLDDNETNKVVQYLRGENLVKFAGMGGEIVIAHDGIKEIEKALSNPNRETLHFPPVMNILQVYGDVISSQIQVGTEASQQLQVNPDLQRVISEFISELKKKIVELKLEGSEHRDISAAIETIMAQLRASEPKPSIIKEALSSIKRILEAAGAALLASKVVELIVRLQSNA